MLTSQHLRTPDPSFLTQGDILGGCWIRQPPGELRFLRKVGSATSGKPDFQSAAEPLEHDRKQYVISEAKRSRAIILSYSCDIDKVLKHIADGNPPTPSEICFIAPVFPIANYHRLVAEIRTDAMENVFGIATGALVVEPTLVIDFSLAQSINMRECLKEAGAREWALTESGRRLLVDRVSRFFGGPTRPMDEAAPSDPTLFQLALTLLGISRALGREDSEG